MDSSIRPIPPNPRGTPPLRRSARQRRGSGGREFAGELERETSEFPTTTEDTERELDEPRDEHARPTDPDPTVGSRIDVNA